MDAVSIGEIRAEELADERLQRLFAYWRGKLAEKGGLPARSDIDPLEIGPDLLPHIMMTELVPPHTDGNERAEARWRYRLVGTAIVEAARRDPTGSFLDDLLPPGYAEFILGLYDALRVSGRPLFAESSYAPPGHALAPERLARRAMLPLARAPGEPEVRFVISAQVFVSLTRANMRGILDDAPFSIGCVAFVGD